MAALLAAFGLGGCASGSGTVGQRMLVPDGVERYGMQEHQAFVFPVAHGNPAPGFPPGYPLRDLRPTTVCLSFVVDEAGHVQNATAQPGPECVPESTAEPLYRQALAQVRQWRFEPAMFCSYPDAVTRDRDWNGRGCNGAVSEARKVPVTLTYAFTFEANNGHYRVGSEKRHRR